MFKRALLGIALVLGLGTGLSAQTVHGGIKLKGVLDQRDFVTFTDLDTTPSVLNANLFKEANTGATTITAFDNGVDGQEITILCTTTNTTISNAGTLKLDGAFVCVVDTAIHLVFDGTNWYEQGRTPDAGGGGTAAQHQVDGVNVITNDPINFRDTTRILVANPSAGNIDFDIATSGIDALGLFAATLCGTNEILEDQGGAWVCIATPSGGAAHDLLSATHTDTLAAAVSQGSMVVGNGTPAWAEVVVGGANTIWGSNGTDPSWETATGTASPVRANNPLFPVQVRFTAISAPSYAAGQLFYDTDDQALGFHNDESDVTLQIGQEEWIRARNESGSTITNGQVVYIDGIASGIPRIALARANVMATSEAVGIVTHDIENLTNGYVTASGLVRDFNTSSFTIGDRLYLSPSVAGALTATAPSDPNFVVPIGIVTEVNATTGDVLVTLGAPRRSGGSGIAVVGNELRTASTEEGFLNSGVLSCGASTAGSMRAHTTPLQYCDNAATPLLQYAAYGASDGDALAGDNATSFFDTGTIEAARLPSAAAATLGVIELDNALGGTAAAVELAAGVAGDGIILNTATAPDSLDIDLNATVDGVGSTSNLSGMEFTATSELALLQGCSDALPVLKWTEASSVWGCAADVSGGSPSLDTITAAVGTASINSGDNAIVWNWQLTTASKNAFEFTENVAGTATGDAVLVDIATLAASTVHPLEVTSRGDVDGIRVGIDGIVVALGSGGLDWPALLNYPTGCTNQFVRSVGDTLTCNDVTLTTDTAGNYVDNVTGGNGIAVTHTPAEGSEPAVAVDLLTADDQVGATSNQSGMEFGDTGSDKLGLLRGCTNTQILKFNTTGGLWECATDATAGSPTLDSIADPVAATDWIFSTTTETLLADFQAAFTAGPQVEFKQSVGDPTGGILVRITVPDVDVTPFEVFDGTNVVFSVAQDGTTTAGTSTAGGVSQLGGASDTGASAWEIFGGDGASNTEPGYLWLHQSATGEDAFLFPCNTDGQMCLSTATPTADSLNVIMTLTTVESPTNKTLDSGLATTTHAANSSFLRGLRHATDCTAITDGQYGERCWEEDANTIYMCENAAGCTVPGDWTALAGGGGLTHTVNGSALASATAIDFDDALPAAPANSVNVNWDKDALDPTNVSASLLLTEIDGIGIGVSGTELIVDLLTADDQVGSTSNQSGMEFGDTGSDKLGLLRGCSLNQILKFNTTGGLWECATDVSGGSPTLDTIAAAAGTATIANGDNAIVWNWFLTTASKSAFTFGETTASTATGTPILINIQTLAASTANPLQVTARGTANGIRVDAATGMLAAIGTGGITATDVASSAGAAPTASGKIAYDTTSNTLEFGENGTNRLVAMQNADNNFSVEQTFTEPITGNVGGGGALRLRATGTSEITMGPTSGATKHKFHITSDSIYEFDAGTLLTNDQEITMEFDSGAALNAGDVVKLDSTTMQVLVATTADTDNIMGVSRTTAAGAGISLDIIIFGVTDDPLLGTGTCAIGDYVIVDTTTNGRVKCTASLPTGAILGVSLEVETTVGNALRMFVNPSIKSVDGGGGGNVDLLDGSVHQDTAAGTAVRGDIITVPVSGNWTRLALGSTNLYPKSDGTDIVYSTLAAGGVGPCTNQFVSALNADAAPTCATVTAADTDETTFTGVTWGANVDFVWNFNTVGGANPDSVISFTGANINISTGTLQEGGVAVSLPARSETLTEKALDVEDSGNVITTVSKIYIDGASCIGATATLNWDDAGTGDTAPTAACNDTGSIQRPSADFAGGAVNSFERTIRLPSDWASAENVDISIRYVSVAASPTGNVEWDVSTICRAAGQTWDAAFNAAQTITDAVAAQNVLNDGDQAAVTMTTCAADEDWSLKVSRDGTNDTNNDLAKLLGVMITLRRDQ